MLTIVPLVIVMKPVNIRSAKYMTRGTSKVSETSWLRIGELQQTQAVQGGRGAYP